MIRHVLRLFFLFHCIIGYGQQQNIREDFLKTYNRQKLQTLISTLQKEASSIKKEKALWLKKNTTQSVINNLNTRTYLSEIGADKTPIYFTSLAFESEKKSIEYTAYSYKLNSKAFGSGMAIGVWDESLPLKSHQEFDQRVNLGDTLVTGSNNHATVTSGILIASGVDKKAKGVLPSAIVVAHDWHQDRLEAAQMASKGLLISNHAYGMLPDNLPSWYFGSYLKSSQQWDEIMHAAPYYQMVVAAGNSKNKGHNSEPLYGTASEGWDVLLGYALSKNAITVASASTTRNLKSATVSDYSNIGPSDDGRIKPDLAFDGNQIYAPSSRTNADYGVYSGTSMASAKVSGFLTLLQEHYFNENTHYMKAATLKCLALHTASDVGKKGPDFKMGWGLLNPENAIKLIDDNGYHTAIKELSLEQGQVYTFKIKANSLEALEAAISWTDPSYNVDQVGNKLNNSRSVLVNDLDIKIIQGNTIHLPWVLDFKQPYAAATKGDNHLDNFEKVSITDAQGFYTIQVSHKGTIAGQVQDFSLVISGAQIIDCFPLAIQEVFISEKTDTSLTFEWDNKGAEASYELQYKLKEDAIWNILYVQKSIQKIQNLQLGKEYDIRIKTVCTESVRSTEGSTFSFLFTGNTTSKIYSVDERIILNKKIIIKSSEEKLILNPDIPEETIYVIFDFIGRKIKEGYLIGGQIDMSNTSSGFYVLVLTYNGDKNVVKFYRQ
jgi:hypothetical protein